MEVLESRRCPSLASAAVSLPVDPNIGLTGQLQGVGSTGLFHVPVDVDGLLTAQLQPLGFRTRLSLLDDLGHLLIQSEASSPQDPADHIALHVSAGSSPLTLPVNDLAQTGWVQESDLMPLDHGALDAVAVLIVVSGTPGEEPIDRGLAPFEEDQAGTTMTTAHSPHEDSTPAGSSSPGVSNLERFLLDLEGAPGRPRGEVPDAAGSWPEWGWQPGGAGSAVANVTSEARLRTSIPVPWPMPSIAPDYDQGPGDGLMAVPLIEGEGLEPGSTAEAEWGLTDGGWLLGEALIATSLLFAARAVGRRMRARGTHAVRQPILGIPERHPTRRPNATRSQRARESRSPDLPPWLAGSTPGRWSSRS
jgi:hypothetical protein